MSIVAAELAPMTATGIAATPARGGYTTVFEGWQYPGVRRLAAYSPAPGDWTANYSLRSRSRLME
ncbi:hypothetical protein DKM18_07200 [Mycobacterium tuberculosis variant bovis]|nr:hypothetical protein DKM18_07200 [Mycobacterium tuberculosis variant bovis]